MKNYERVSLDNLLKLERRPVQINLEEMYAEIGVYCFGRGIFHKPPRSGADVGDKNLYQIKEGDFILQITFAWEGAVAIASKANDGMFGSVRFLTFRVKEEYCYPPYLLNYFKTGEGMSQLNKISPGSAGRNRVLSIKRIPEIIVPLPPVDEQRRIIARIEGLAAKIEEMQGLRKETIQDADRLLSTMAHRRDLSREEKIRLGWTEVTLHEVLRETEDASIVKPNESYQNLGIYSYGRGLFKKPPIQGNSTSALKLYRVRKGQFIYSRLFAFEGSYGWVSDEFDGYFVSGEYPTFDCDAARIRVEFLFAYFKSPAVWKDVAVGSKGLGHRRQRVKSEQFLSHRLLIPPLEWQARIAEVLNLVTALNRLQTDTAAELDALLPSILDKAFKGEL